MSKKQTKGSYLPNLEEKIAAGVDPNTGLPIRTSDESNVKSDIVRLLRIVDEQDAVNRYEWYNLPSNITSQELERLIYLKGQLCFYYDDIEKEFYFMPYALNGSIDYYGRYKQITPIPLFWGESDSTEEKSMKKKQEQVLSGKKLDVIYSVVDDKEKINENFLTTSTVLLHDYTKQLPQTIVPRSILNKTLVEIEAECVPYLRTALIAGSGIKGVIINDASQSQSVIDAAKSMKNAALKSMPWIPLTSMAKLEELTDGSVLKAEEYMASMQSLDNLRLSTFGIENGGLFEKKSHKLQAEADFSTNPVHMILQDGLKIRQNFCNIVNSIWDIDIWCEASEMIPNIPFDEIGETETNDNKDMEVTDNADDTTI